MFLYLLNAFEYQVIKTNKYDNWPPRMSRGKQSFDSEIEARFSVLHFLTLKKKKRNKDE